MRKRKIIVLTSIALVFLMAGFTYAFVSYTLNGQKRQIITASDLSVELLEDEELIIENALPMYDEVGKIQEDYFSFQVVNKSNYKVDYTLHLADITEEAVDKLNYEDVKYYLTKEKEERAPKLLSERDNDIIDTGSIAKKSTIHYTLRLWIDSNVEDNNEIYQKMLKFKLVAEIKKEAKEQYKVHYETGTDLVIEDGLKVEGEDFQITSVVPIKSNHTFLGWSTVENGEIEYQADSLYTEDKDLMLYAVWGINYLYNQGNQFVSDTGGWTYTRTFFGDPSVSAIAGETTAFTSSYIQWSETDSKSDGTPTGHGAGYFQNSSAINLFNAKKISFHYTVTNVRKSSYGEYYPYVIFYINGSGSASKSVKVSANYTSMQTLSIDVSNLNMSSIRTRINCSTVAYGDITMTFRLYNISVEY